MIYLSDPITKITGISDKTALKLEYLGITSVRDLLYHFPFRYEDSSNIKTIKEILIENLTEATVKVTIESISTNYGFGGKKLTKAKAFDTTGQIDIIWFNQPYLVKSLCVGTTAILHGKCKVVKSRIQFVSPQHEIYSVDNSSKHLARISAVYPETFGINSKWIRNKMDSILKAISIEDTLSQEIKTRNKLIDLKEALFKIHFPNSYEDIDKAKARLGFEELYVLQLRVVQEAKEKEQLKSKAQVINVNEINEFIKNLKFTPTNAQIKAIKEICSDLIKPISMNRLLEGDVGSGKTMVATTIALNTILNGQDCAIMAPTTILAQQHYKSFSNFFGDKISIQLLTTHTKNKIESTLEPSIYIGTQALLFNSHHLNNLGLVIIDEQHRFGVRQRDFLASLKNEQGLLPHFLTMTATPIPRTLALTLFGDINLSILDEMPKGRIPIDTFVITQAKRKDSYEFVKKEIEIGNQAFVICPLIDESESEKMKEVKSAIMEFEHIKEIFPNAKVILIHGRMKENEKAEILEKFRNHEFDILVSTSVVEVGIDIPNATFILIESAERFGLAQLHQLRGRVGRSDKKSYCMLYPTKNGKNERLTYFASHNNGLDLSEYDLSSRGPGEVYGFRQSGIPNLKIANILDIETVKRARDEAINTLQDFHQ